MQTELPLKLFVYNHIERDETFDEWDEKMEELGEWKFHPIYNDNVLTAVVLVLNSEIHVVIDPEYKGKWFKVKQISKIFSDILKEHGKVITCVTYGDKESMDFVEKLGFMPNKIEYILEAKCH